MKKTVLITGASSGIGLATAKRCLQQGYYVVATVRTYEKGKHLQQFAEKTETAKNLFLIEIDVASDDSVARAFQTIKQEKLSIDVLVNNAGFGLFGEIKNLSLSDFKKQFETNLFGVYRITQAVLPHLMKQNSGTIINISSISGKVVFPFFGAYASSKFALEGYTQALWMELFKTNIRIYLVEPGPVETNFYKNVRVSQDETQKEINREEHSFFARLNKKLKIGSRSTPNIIAQKIIDLIEGNSQKLRHPAGSFAGTLLFFQKVLPDHLFLKLIQNLY